MKLVHSLEQFGLDRAIDMAYKDPDKNLMKIMDWADKFAGDDFVGARKAIRKQLEDKDSPYQKYILILSTTSIRMWRRHFWEIFS